MKSSSITVGVVASVLAFSAAATEYEYSVSVGAGTSDNITRVPIDELSETIATAGLDLRFIRQDRRIDSDIDIDLSYLDYLDNTFDSNVSGMANANIRYKIIPESFEWVFTDSYGELTLEPFEAQTPDTLENINYFTTGPDLTVRLGSLGSLTLLGRYSLTQYEESNFDDDRLLGGVSLGRELSGRGVLSINATTERVEFDDPAFGSNYDRQSAFLGYEMENARTRLRVEAGYSVIHDLNASNGSPLLELDITRDISERSVVTFLGGIRSSDAASAIRADNVIGGGIPSRPEQVSTTDPFESRYATLGWRFSAQRTSFVFSAGYVDDTYETLSQLDRTGNYFYASAERELTDRFSLRAEGSLQSSDYDTAGQDEDETQLGIYLSWNVTGRLYVEIYGEKFDRTSSNPLTEFEETRAFITLSWRDQGGSSAAR